MILRCLILLVVLGSSQLHFLFPFLKNHYNFGQSLFLLSTKIKRAQKPNLKSYIRAQRLVY